MRWAKFLNTFHSPQQRYLSIYTCNFRFFKPWSLDAESLVCTVQQHEHVVCIANCQRWCWRAVFTSNRTGKAKCIGYKLYFETLVLHFWNQFYKRRQRRYPREKLTDSHAIFSHLQTRTQVRFSVRLEDASLLSWLERKDANEVLMFLGQPEMECNSLFLLLFVLPLPFSSHY